MNKKKIDNNKGFTLVELIVVLVILAILAAILVPALLGYIDRARGQQIVLNARSAYTAAQAEMTSKYAKIKSTDTDITLTENEKERIRSTADVPGTIVEIGCKAKYASGTAANKQHDAFTITYVEYTEGTETVYLFDGEWVSKTDLGNAAPDKTKASAANAVGASYAIGAKSN